jgi:hypothetical protein
LCGIAVSLVALAYHILAESDDLDTGILYCCYGASDVEESVIGRGKVEGPFTEIDGLEIERDERYPVRVTVQFFKATSNGAVYYRVHALPDEIIWLVMPTRKPRKSKNSKEPSIDEDGIHGWFFEDPLKDERDRLTDWGKGVWYTCVATAINVKRIVRAQIGTRLDASDSRLEAMEDQLNRIERKLDRLLAASQTS